MLTENSREIAVKATAEVDGYRYDVSYNTAIDGKTLQKLHCNVYKKATDTEVEMYIGLMFQESGNKQISLKQDVDMVPHLTVFNQLLSEVNASLNTESAE